MRIAITGSTGLIGRAVTAALRHDGHEVLHLVRPPRRSGPRQIAWNPATGAIDAQGLEGMDAVIHLAGEPLTALRWTAAKKRRIYESRADGTRLLARTLAGLDQPPQVLISQSAAGFYGDRGDEILTEESQPGVGFLSRVAVAWEQATAPASDRGIRVVLLRGAPVLAPHSPFITRLLPAFRLGIGGPFGSGRQWWPWIVLDDLVRIVQHVLQREELYGPVNVVAPELHTNREFVRSLGYVLRRPALIPIFPPILRAFMGEVAQDMLLSSQRVEPRLLLSSGFRFEFPTLEPAIRHVLDRPAN